MAIARCSFTISWSLAIKFNLGGVNYILEKIPNIKLRLGRFFEPPTGAKIVVFSDPTGTEIDLMDLPTSKH
jgi:hypothetical protein